MKTEQQLKNIRDALEWWPTVPPENVSSKLRYWTESNTDETSCKTIACFGGWCARRPELQAQGLILTTLGVPWGASDKSLFGDNELWDPRDCHPADGGFIGTDHELVTNRLKWALEN